MAFRGGVPDVLGGQGRGRQRRGRGVQVGWDELAADAEAVADVPDVLQAIGAPGSNILLGKTDRAQVQAPAFTHPGGSGLQVLALIDGAAVIGELQVGDETARTRRDIQRVVVHPPTGIQTDLDVSRRAPQRLGRLRVEGSIPALRIEPPTFGVEVNSRIKLGVYLVTLSHSPHLLHTWNACYSIEEIVACPIIRTRNNAPMTAIPVLNESSVKAVITIN
jgi:hypothetical protein